MTVGKEVFELKFWLINWLNVLNGISGNGLVTCDAFAIGSIANPIIQIKRVTIVETGIFWSLDNNQQMI
jgi:hypothetical protein